jgi:hypothetical protein
MARVSIVPPEKAVSVASSSLFSSSGEIHKYLDDERDPIHVHVHTLARGAVLRIAPTLADCLTYVWHGVVSANEQALVSGSSLVVERGAVLILTSTADATRLVTFYASAQSSKHPNAYVHLLPNERVPRFGSIAAGDVLTGGWHADATGSPCAVWLHENTFAPPAADAPRTDAEAGIHSHAEDEVIFVTAGQMRLGQQLYGPGTALAVAASTMYSFVTGPEGLSFINFRPGLPRDIQFKNGKTMDEVGYWRERVARPQPISIASG